MESALLPVLFSAVLFAAFLVWRLLRPRRREHYTNGSVEDQKETPADPYQAIEPLENFDWLSTEPIRIRPFKPKFYLSMGLENCPLSELIMIDETYLERMQTRESVMDEHREHTYQCDATCDAAVMEMYEWMFGTYLPRRFPTMYKLVSPSDMPTDSKTNGPCLYNIPADRYIPLEAPSASEALYTLGKNVDTDVLILLPSSTAEDGSPIYHLQAYVCCFPAGFTLPEKFRKPLAAIHKPVPSYKEKIEKSMDRFFAKLEVGKAVRRVNWSITTDDKLFTQEGNHMYSNGQTEENAAAHKETAVGENPKTLDVDSPNLEESIERQREKVVIEECRLRCERQTLHRLPKTKALVFAFKTYQYTLEDVKAEGSGPALVEAIEGLTLGNAPDMQFYKRGVVWGDKVIEYLRS